MSPLSLLILFALLIVATITDVRTHSIYNWTTYTGLFLAFLLRGLEGGTESAQEGVAGAVGLGGLMLVGFLLFDVGGGDLKLLTMIGAFVGWSRGVEILLWTFVLGGIGAAAMLVWQEGAWNIMVRTGRHLAHIVRYRGWVPLTDADRAPLKRLLFLAPAAFMAAIIVNYDLLKACWELR